MPRRQVIEDTISHERWLVSYADFITLLFAFFVVMYSISQVNEGKYRILSSTLTQAFNQRERTLDPFQVGEPARANPISLIDLNAMAIREKERGEEDAGTGLEQQRPGGMPEEFREISDRLQQDFAELLEDGQIRVRGNEEWLEVQLQSSLLFSSGDAQLSTPAMELLGEIAAALRNEANPVRIEGFTDNVPISNARFRSNWDLSAARALAVVQLFIEEGIAPDRLAAIGYGEHQPIADNDSAEGRERNRRVVLMISKTGAIRPALGDNNSYQLSPPPDQSAVPESDALPAPAITDTASDPVNDLPVLVPAETAEATAVPEPGPVLNEIVPPEAVAAPQSPEGAAQQIQTIQLEGGGLLFTSEPRPEPPATEPD